MTNFIGQKKLMLCSALLVIAVITVCARHTAILTLGLVVLAGVISDQKRFRSLTSMR